MGNTGTRARSLLELGGKMLNLLTYITLDIAKILGQERYIYITPYKVSARPAKGCKKPLQRRKMMRR